MHLNTRFNQDHDKVLVIEKLIPKNIIKLEDDDIIKTRKTVCEFYEEIEEDSLVSECFLWRNKFFDMNNALIPSTICDSIQWCHSILYPNLYKLHQIFIVLPVTSANCERAFSSLKTSQNVFTHNNERRTFKWFS